MGISGDLPIVLLRIDDIEDLDIVRQLLQAHEYWRMKQLAVDLVILNERASSYVQDLQIALETQVRTSQSRPPVGEERRRGPCLRAARRPDFAGSPRACSRRWRGSSWSDSAAALADQLDRVPEPEEASRITAKPALRAGAERVPTRAGSRPQLEFFNGLGGFAEDGREYVTILGPGQSTPAPWINVIANPAFGFQVAAEGSGYTWSVNSRENQLTPGRTIRSAIARVRCSICATTTPASCGVRRRCRSATTPRPTSRGTAGATAGSSTPRTASPLELLQYVPLDDPIKISRLTLRNTSRRVRQRCR